MQPISLDLKKIRPHYKVVVVGSGYGAGVAAARMARAGQSVCVLERGEEILPGDYPADLAEMKDQLQVNTSKQRLGSSTSLFEFHMNPDMNALVGCGLGGTSLINANVALEVEQSVIQQEHWPKPFRDNPDLLAPYYDKAREYLSPSPYPTGRGIRKPNKLQALEASAKKMGKQCVTPLINVNFEDKTNAFGVPQQACTDCGDCCSGCNYGAKNTTLMNYLPDARNHHAEIFTRTNVEFIERVDDKWKLSIKINTPDQHKKHSKGNKLLTITADIVMLGAGSLGSTGILLRSRDRGLKLSHQLGRQFSGNGDALAFGYNNYWKKKKKSRQTPNESSQDTSKPAESEYQEIYGVGIGKNDKVPKEAWPGPCITGLIDLRSKDVATSLVIEEGVIPGALATLLPATFMFGALQSGSFFQYGPQQAEARLMDAKNLGEAIQDHPETMGLQSYEGPVGRTQTYLVMSHDSAKGRLLLKDDRIRIDWPGAGDAASIKRDNKILAQANSAIKGQFIPNIVWSEPFGNQLVTVHPVGGCAMADDAARGVVDHQCRVFDGVSNTSVHEGLYVCDGAVMPGSVGVNPLLTITAVAERACALIAEQNGWTLDDEVAPATEYPPEMASKQDLRKSSNSHTLDNSDDAESADEQRDMDQLEEELKKQKHHPSFWKRIKKLIHEFKHGVISEAESLLRKLIEDHPDYFSPTLEFTESMHGYYSEKVAAFKDHGQKRTRIATDHDIAFKVGQAANNAMHFDLTIKTKDLNKLTTHDDHKAKIKGTVTCACLSDDPMTVTKGVFSLLPPDSTRVETWLMTYELQLKNGSQKFFFDGTKHLHQKEGSSWFTDLTRLNVDLYEGGNRKGKLLGKAILNLTLEDLLIQMNTVKVGLPKGHPFVKHLMKWIPKLKAATEKLFLAKFAAFFGMTVLKAYGGVLADLKDFPRAESLKRKKRKLKNLPKPKEFIVDLGVGFSNKLTRYHGGNKGPVILAPGFPVTASSFAIDTVDQNLVEYLAGENNYDVFLLDYRSSPDSGSTSFNYTLDDIALKDWQASIKKVCDITGKPDVQVVAHCIGSMTLLMSLLAGTKGVRSIISSQVTLHPVTNWLNYMKADVGLIGYLEKAIGKNIPLTSIASCTRKEAIEEGYAPDKVDKALKQAALVDVICWNMPIPQGEECKNPCCRRIFTIFGPSYLHAQLNHETHIAMREMFGPAPTKPFEQLSRIFEAKHVVNTAGDNTYLRNVENLKLPISFLAGELNQLILPETSARTYEWLCEQNGPDFYERLVFPDYGHMDFFIGKNASVDIFPTIGRILDKTS